MCTSYDLRTALIEVTENCRLGFDPKPGAHNKQKVPLPKDSWNWLCKKEVVPFLPKKVKSQRKEQMYRIIISVYVLCSEASKIDK